MTINERGRLARVIFSFEEEFGKGGIDREVGPEALESQERLDRVLDEEFWEELLFSEKFEGRLDIPTAEDRSYVLE